MNRCLDCDATRVGQRRCCAINIDYQRIPLRHRPLWAVPHAAISRCDCWIRGRITHGPVTVDVQHPLAWAAGVLERFRREMGNEDRDGR